MHHAIIELKDVEHFHWRLSETESPLSFSSNGNGMSLPAAIELACIAAHWGTKVHEPATAIRIANCHLWKLLKATRWPERSNRTRVRDGDVAVVVLPQKANDSWWLQCVRDLLNELKANGFPTRLAGSLAGAVVEMADNIWLHSEADSPGLMAYQIRRRQFAFSVADMGIGVLASLRKNPRHRYLSSSMEAVRAAIQPGISRFEDGSGLGFPSLLHALADLWGTARIRSGEARLVIDRTQDQRKKHSAYLPQLPGVHVSARCALDAPTAMTRES